ncbi:serine carboxypeptidase-like 16 isoform X2 [Nicotiana sylvestris]|uniref:serine carboxypeptidase-like 16 isoform X2 n=1 Tax=Nicotiana sylvestris TaxID=4096 RepID=UPI00388C8FF2
MCCFRLPLLFHLLLCFYNMYNVFIKIAQLLSFFLVLTTLFLFILRLESDPRKDPLLLWLSGGPGCSSFYGLAYEVGPLAFGQKAFNGSLPILISTPYSWTKFASILFLEQPVNTGFSYATTSAASECTDLQACDHVYEFLLKWFINHPDFILNPLYVSGDSYSGITVPVIAQLISDDIIIYGELHSFVVPPSLNV